MSVASPWNLSAWAAYDNAVTDYAVAAVAVGNLKAKKLIAEEDKIRAVLIETYSQGVYDLANTDYGTTTAAGSKLYIATGTLATKTTANTKWETAKTHAASALSEKDAAVARRTALNTQLAKDEVEKGIKEYLQTAGVLAFNNATAAKAATVTPLARLLLLKTEATKGGARAAAWNTFY